MSGLLSNFGQKAGGVLSSFGKGFGSDKFQNFLQTPEALALAASLLKQGQPSFNQHPSLGAGLSEGFSEVNRLRDIDRQRKIQEQLAELAKKRFGLEESRFGLDKSKYDFELEQLQLAREAEAKRRENLIGQGDIADNADGSDDEFITLKNGRRLSVEQYERYIAALQLGNYDEAEKILLEKGEKGEAVPASMQEAAIAAEGILNDLEQLDTEALVQYSGGLGGIQKGLNAFAEMIGIGGTENYQNYTDEYVRAKFLAQQARSAFKDPASQTVLEKVEKLLDPESWGKSPETARRNIQTAKKILTEHAQSRIDAVKRPGKRGKKPSQSSDVSDTNLDPLDIL